MQKILFNNNTKYNFLSNFYEEPYLVKLSFFDEIYYFNSVENAFQCAKIIYCKNKLHYNESLVIIEKFQNIKPWEAKKFIKEFDIDKHEWNKDRLSIMERLLQQKFRNNTLKNKLLETCSKELIEYNTGSKFWGVDSNMSGDNMLGNIIMRIRSELENI